MLSLDQIGRAQDGGDLLGLEERAARALGLRRRGLQRGYLADEHAALLRVPQHALGSIECLANRSIGHPSPTGLVAGSGARVADGSHQRHPLGCGVLDRRPFLAQFDDQLVGEAEIQLVDGRGAELVHDHRETPLEVANRLGAPLEVAGP
jgi:hypothetical protein